MCHSSKLEDVPLLSTCSGHTSKCRRTELKKNWIFRAVIQERRDTVGSGTGRGKLSYSPTTGKKNPVLP